MVRRRDVIANLKFIEFEDKFILEFLCNKLENMIQLAEGMKKLPNNLKILILCI